MPDEEVKEFTIYDKTKMMRVVDVVRRKAKKPGGVVSARLHVEIECFLAGLKGKFPKHWKKFVEVAEREAEYAEYQRLRQKFESDR